MLLRRELSPEDRVRCLVVAGTGLLRSGVTDEGRAHLVRAVDSAEGIDDSIACHARVWQVAGLASWVGPEAASLEVSATRRLVTTVGKPEHTIRFHLTLAEIAAKHALLRRAKRHLDVASELLSSYPNQFLIGEHAIRAGAISALSSDLEGAAAYAIKAIDLAVQAGAPTLEVVARSNLAHVFLAQGTIVECGKELSTALTLCRSGGSAELGIRDGLLQQAMASELPDVARRMAEETFEKSLGVNGGYSYYGLWHLLTRVKWLYRTGDAEGGVALAMDAIPRIERMADRNLLERMKLLAAEGLGRVGKATEGASLMAEAVNANPDPPLEMLAEAARVAGRLSADHDRSAAIAHFERAGRILQSVGNLTARAEIQRDAIETISGLSLSETPPSITGHHAVAPRTDAGPTRATDGRPAAAPLAERIAALVDFAAHPPLLATETLALIADTESVAHATIAELRADGTRELLTTVSSVDSPSTVDDHPHAVRITLGRHRDRVYEITAIPRASAAARATLLAVERLVQTSLAICKARHFEREQAALLPEHTPERQLGLVCSSDRMMDLIKSIRRVAGTNMTVLLTGETGVGKELLARALHQASARHERPFLPVNCTTIPREILVSELFGYRKGAFTSAHEDSPGLIRSVAGGTLFLDEIGELSAEAQPKLLRFLESGEILPLGESRPQTVDVRIVAATNANLDQLINSGKFREDLYYRLNVIPLRVPPLRERREEIPMLVEHFLEQYARELQKPMSRVAEETLEYLVLFRWPGNVRQLGHEIRRLVALAEPGAVLMPEHLSPEITASRRTIAAGERPLEPTEILMRTDQPLAAAMEHLERALIQRALKQCDGRVEDAARMLGLSRKGLYLKRVRLGID